MSAVCSVCSRAIDEIKPCPYNRRGQPTCDDCCEKCYRSEPFPCREHDERFGMMPKRIRATGPEKQEE